MIARTYVQVPSSHVHSIYAQQNMYCTKYLHTLCTSIKVTRICWRSVKRVTFGAGRLTCLVAATRLAKMVSQPN